MSLIVEERLSDSPFVERVWRSQSGNEGVFTSIAVVQWDLVFTHLNGETTVTVHGPETGATSAPVPEDAEFFGILFKVGTTMPHLPVGTLVDSYTALPEAASQSFWLHGAAWQFPNYENADTFVDRLVREGLLIREPVVDAVLRNQPPLDLSTRTVQRRFLNATGLTHGAVLQIERARRAAILLQRGVPILDVIEEAGYFDQPHMTKALKRFIGRTPAQLMDKDRTGQLSFLSKTTPLE